MIQIAICDDQLSELERTQSMIQTYCSQHPELNISLHRFTSGRELLESIHRQKHFNIYLLDILMPDANGIEVGTAIRQSDSTAVILYLTSSPDYALQSYQVDAGGYLLKPFNETELFTTLDKVLAKLDAEEQKRLVIQISRDSIESIPYSHLIYLEYYQHRLIAHTVEGKIVESIYHRKSFPELAASLADSRFVKANASVVINMQHIRNINSKEVQLSDGKNLVLSRQYSTMAKKTFMNYLLERGNKI
ncbi:MAG: response regulator transcription factor [Lachnospiraceae bacterium]|nr:response regulator transcription factor [Lachnospiraceae bacterium]